MNKDNIKLKVSAIKNGTVIDHISATNLFKVIKILDLKQIQTQITFGTNLESKKLGKKAIIKISEYFFKDEDINKIALVSPEARLNIIKNYLVVEKRNIEIPDKVQGIVKCVNPKCITNHQNVLQKFNIIVSDERKISLKCHYCEKVTSQDDMKFIV